MHKIAISLFTEGTSKWNRLFKTSFIHLNILRKYVKFGKIKKQFFSYLSIFSNFAFLNLLWGWVLKAHGLGRRVNRAMDYGYRLAVQWGGSVHFTMKDTNTLPHVLPELHFLQDVVINTSFSLPNKTKNEIQLNGK